MDKMKQPILKAIAVFLIGIIISLPIYSSSVLAGLSSPKVYGADGIDGYLRKEETIFFNITAEIPGDSDITPSQVHLVDLSGPEFNACYSIGSNRFVCEYMMASSSISGDTFSFNALLYNDANALVPPKVAMRGAFDDLAPEIISFSISPSITRGGPVTIQYTVYDHSYSLTDIGRCSGINKVELSASGNIFNTTEFRTSPNSCERSGSLTVNITSITSIDGTIDITLTAYDNFDQASSAVAYITYDTSPPEIDISSLHIRDASNNEIEYVTDAPVNAKVSFAIPSPDLNPNSVYGDITEINKDSPPEYLHRQAACNLASDGGYNCTFNNIEVKLAQTTNVNIRINASDIAGNPSSAVLAKTIYYDITGPAITIIRTELVDAGKSYVGNSLNTFIVEFSEEGIGVDKNSMRLDLSSVKTGLTNKAADECTSSACYWYNITADKSDGGKVISVLSSSSDKLNNLVTGSLAGNVTVDRTPPGQVSSNISSIGTGEEAIPGKIKTTDRISLKTKATEKSTLRAYADFSALITTQNNESGSCAKGDDDRWQCEWLSEPIDVPGMLQTTIPVTYTDFAGNSYTQSPQIKVYNYSSITSPSYWANSVSCSPLPVDRQITSLINYKVICSITLIPLTADQETLSISFENCEDDAEGSTAYIASAELLNANVGSTNPYLSFSLSKTEMRIDRISLKCPLNIKTRAGSQIMQYPETENIIVGISLYDMPLGEFDQATIGKIKDVEDTIAVGWTWISTLKKILFYAEKLCSIQQLLNKVQVLFGLLEQIPAIGSKVHPLSVFIAKWTTGQNTLLTKFCKILSCDYTLWGNWYTGQQSLFLNEYSKEGRGENYNLWGDKFGIDLKEAGLSAWPKTPKESIILSVATGCIPGLIYGIEKWRQIQCNYGVCLWDSAENNIPIKTCEDQKSYLECKFLWGEIFQLVPFQFMRQFGQMIAAMFSDPISLVFAFIGYLCPPAPKSHGICAVFRGIVIIGSIITDFQALTDSNNWKVQGDMCEVYFDRLDELEGEGDEED